MNLARKLTDGEQILVGVPRSQASTSPGVDRPGGAARRLDLNTATPEQLEELPGIGPVLAKRILSYRTEHGGFRSTRQLLDVSGIGPATYQDLKGKVRV